MNNCILVTGGLLGPLTDPRRGEITALLPGREILDNPARETVESRVADIEIVFGSLPLELLPRATSLRWIQLQGAGADNVAQATRGLDVVLTNASGVHAVPISEHILAMMFALARGLHRALRAQAVRRWDRAGSDGIFELEGSAVLLIGTGAIGGAFARKASGLGMRVVGVRRHPELGGEAMERVVGRDRLAAELPLADFVVLTVPGTEETRGMIGARELALMQRSACIINIGRGKSIDERALVDALASGTIAGAGLDVFEREPLPEDSPLWGMENVLITAHYSGNTPRYGERLWEIFLDNLGRYGRGEAMRNVVDRELGY